MHELGLKLPAVLKVCLLDRTGIKPEAGGVPGRQQIVCDGTPAEDAARAALEHLAAYVVVKTRKEPSDGWAEHPSEGRSHVWHVLQAKAYILRY
jgi:hypothetical protein